ncbi:MAG TPA: hypothetical protein VLS89_17165, partial [Candidatus Nanopelagicales bacterium]|nr:hypothetical protein [Candidatus Nanopelagicales bacterium]
GEEHFLRYVLAILERHSESVEPVPHGREGLLAEEDLEGPIPVQGPVLAELATTSPHAPFLRAALKSLLSNFRGIPVIRLAAVDEELKESDTRLLST